MPSESDTRAERDPASPRARLAAEAIIAAVSASHFERPLDRIVQTEFRGRRDLNSAERRWVSEAVYGTVRNWRRQYWILRERGLDASPAHLIQQWREGPQAMDSASFVPEFNLPGPEQPGGFLRETLSFPDSIATELESLLGEEAIPAGEALNRQAPTVIRVNTLRAGMDQVRSKLPQTKPAPFSPLALELPHRVNIHELPGFKDGWFELQEEASQLAAILCDARPGDTVVEVGAGGGGKSLALAAMMQNRGRVFALDSSASRLGELEKRAKRARASNIEPVGVHAGDTGSWQLSGPLLRKIDNLTGKARCVLLDAPCTGSGVLRRSPDIKWREHHLEAFARLQSVLLAQSSAFVAPEGVLVYVTCALERSQNEDVIEGFLRSDVGKEFEITPALPRLQAGALRCRDLAGYSSGSLSEAEEPLGRLAAGPFLRTWPHRHNLDAFYAACLTRS